MDISVEINEAIPIEVEITGANVIMPTDHIYMFSPDGATWRITISDDGKLEREKVI